MYGVCVTTTKKQFAQTTDVVIEKVLEWVLSTELKYKFLEQGNNLTLSKLLRLQGVTTLSKVSSQPLVLRQRTLQLIQFADSHSALPARTYIVSVPNKEYMLTQTHPAQHVPSATNISA